MPRIMLVDDDAHQRELYQQELSDEGYDVVLCSDGRQAIERLKEAEPDLVVMDISMPGLDGIEAMNQLLAVDHKLPIILNTAYATYKNSFRSWSADAYVVKSSDLTELKKQIRAVLEKYGRA